MTIVRAFLAAVISLSVALIPATVAGLSSTKPVEMAMVGQMDAPCCPRCDAQGDFKSPAACAIKCASFFPVILPAIISLPHVIEVALPSIAGDKLRGHERSPPTHPPPV